jgi:hypothetical protein
MKFDKPPHLAEMILLFLARRVERHSLIDDLAVEFTEKSTEMGESRARRWYWRQVGRTLLPFLYFSMAWKLSMLMNYFKSAIRQFRRYRLYSTLNILGLAVGMASAIFIFLWVEDELHYDRFHEKGDRIGVVYLEFPELGASWENSSIPMGPALETGYPEVVHAVRYGYEAGLFLKDDIRIRQRGGYVDPAFFEVFSFPFLKGDLAAAFTMPNSIVITQDMALRFFGDADPMGKVLQFDHEIDYVVTGVLRSIPEQSTIQFDFLLPFRILEDRDRDPTHWTRFQLSTFLLLREGVLFTTLEEKIVGLVRKHSPDYNVNLRIQPFKKRYLYGVDNNNRIQYVRLFSLIGGFILLIACINFMNLSTARFSMRAREVGLRKVMGAQKRDLILQFMGETAWLCLVAFGFSVVIVLLFQGWFSVLAEKELSLLSGNHLSAILGVAGILLVTACISGVYPSIYLSSLQPVRVLGGTLIHGVKRGSFRQFLVVIQFSISIFLLIATLFVAKQLHFIQSRHLGYDRDCILYLRMQGDMRERVEVVKMELEKDSNILSTSAASELIVDVGRNYRGLLWEGKREDQDIHFGMLSVDYDYIETMGMEMIEGRFFSREYTTDTSAYILNETAVDAMGLDSPVGKWIEWGPRGTIVGVVKDFHFKSLQYDIVPIFITVVPGRYNYLLIRVGSTGAVLQETLHHMEGIWNRFASEFPFEYRFLDDAFNNMYLKEARIERLFRTFTFLAVFISCLGLFGLASFTTEQRTKEVGIRKVLGSSVIQILLHFVAAFVKWVVLANLIAWPVAYWIMRRWLGNYAYRASLNLLPFVFAGLMALGIAVLTVSYQLFMAARVNPVESLRYE